MGGWVRGEQEIKERQERAGGRGKGENERTGKGKDGMERKGKGKNGKEKKGNGWK